MNQREKKITEILISPPNIDFFKKLLLQQFCVETFNLVGAEFPILMTENYGFIDVIGGGLINGKEVIIILEMKNDEKDRVGAMEQLDGYVRYFKLFPDDIIRIYHNKLINESFLHLTELKQFPMVFESLNIPIGEITRKYSEFNLNNLIDKIPDLAKDVDIITREISEGKIIGHPYSLFEGGKWKNYLYTYIDDGSTSWVKLSDNIKGIPKTIVPNKNLSSWDAYQKLIKICENKKRFFIHLYKDGYRKPNFFLELDDNQFLCFQHIGFNTFDYVGIYDENVAMDFEKRLVYSTRLVDSGKYHISPRRHLKMLLFLDGEEFQIKMELSFEQFINYKIRSIDSGKRQTRLFCI